MARKPNHAYQKRQRELAKQAKRREKLERKRAAREAKEAEQAEARSLMEELSALAGEGLTQQGGIAILRAMVAAGKEAKKATG